MESISGQPLLQNIRILDFSWVLAGPFATRLLADFGAEVIKVQPLLREAEDKFSQGYYNTWNRNKLGISLNMEKSAGLEIAKKLVRISDAVVENFSPRVMENWGMDFTGLKTIKPDIILLSMSVMGHSGPWRDYVGFGPTAQAFSGITCLTSYPGQPPSGPGFSYADHIAGLYACLALLGALEYRLNTGEGQFIDLSQTEAMTSLLSDAILEYTQKGKETNPEGNFSGHAAPYGVFPCSGENRWCAISVTTDKEWEGFKQAAGNPAWADEDRFSTSEGRLNHVEALDRLIEGWTSIHRAEDIMAALQKRGVPAGLVQNATDLAHDPQLKARGFFVGLEHPVLGKTTADATPIHFSENSADYRRAAPLRGQDNDYVYRRLLNMSESEINRLRQDGII